MVSSTLGVFWTFLTQWRFKVPQFESRRNPNCLDRYVYAGPFRQFYYMIGGMCVRTIDSSCSAQCFGDCKLHEYSKSLLASKYVATIE
jgi:hypothetical protein